MRFFTAALLGASMIVAAPALAQEAPAAPAGYAPYAYAPYAAPGYVWQVQPAVTERRSKGMRIMGITLFALGGVANAIGAGIFTAGALASCPIFEQGAEPPPARAHRIRARERVGISQQALGDSNCGGTKIPLGATVMAAGFLATIGGIPLLVFGDERVRVQRQQGAAPAPELHVGLGGADLRWMF
jgi:hypothetical protein